MYGNVPYREVFRRVLFVSLKVFKTPFALQTKMLYLMIILRDR